MISNSVMAPAISDVASQITSQRRLLEQLEPLRLISSAVAFGLMMLYLPPWVPLTAMGLDLICEGFGFGLMKGLDPATAPQRYRLLLVSIFAMEFAYSAPCLLIWQQDAAFAKALAIGMLSMTLFQLTTVRAIHLPFGVVGLVAVSLTALIGNGYYWVTRHDLAGLLLSTLGAVAAIIYTLGAMQSNHALHLEISKRGGEADAANRAKGRFLAQMSHELRTPLNAILGMGEAELAVTQDPETQERMRTLVTSAIGLAVILDDILEMSAIEENVLPIRPVIAAPQEVIAATVALFRPVYSNAGLWLTLHCAADIPAHALLDPQRLRQCLSNLLSNALKFTETGGATVRANYCAQGNLRSGLLQIEISDTGKGIAPQEEALVFQPFQRGAGTQTGSGLGLAISRALARQMGGELALIPRPAGACFRLTLRIEPVEPAATAPPDQLNLSGRRILVVDDIATNRLVAATYLRLLSATVQEVASGAAAVAAIRADPPDLVMLDMNMPGLSGLETLAQIRALPGPPLPVLAMTADASASDRRSYLAAGLDGYLAKPLTPESVRAALAAHLASA